MIDGEILMKVFTVGGAVRDMLMGVKPQDIDYVVVGATENQMFLDGFSKIGADFPVFLHPKTGDEYALARRERKTGTGYGGFETDTGSMCTLSNGVNINTLDKDVLEKFVSAGYSLDKEYETKELIEFFLRINQ
jgi:tRNA nucleotidyltransferase (CCA-adding enzyme)